MIEMGIDSLLLKQIVNGHKTVEGRLNKGKFLQLQVGDKIQLREDIWQNGTTPYSQSLVKLSSRSSN